MNRIKRFFGKFLWKHPKVVFRTYLFFSIAPFLYIIVFGPSESEQFYGFLTTVFILATLIFVLGGILLIQRFVKWEEQLPEYIFEKEIKRARATVCQLRNDYPIEGSVILLISKAQQTGDISELQKWMNTFFIFKKMQEGLAKKQEEKKKIERKIRELTARIPELKIQLGI